MPLALVESGIIMANELPYHLMTHRLISARSHYTKPQAAQARVTRERVIINYYRNDVL